LDVALNNYIVVVFDSCRFDSWAAAAPPNLARLGEVDITVGEFCLACHLLTMLPEFAFNPEQADADDLFHCCLKFLFPGIFQPLSEYFQNFAPAISLYGHDERKTKSGPVRFIEALELSKFIGAALVQACALLLGL